MGSDGALATLTFPQIFKIIGGTFQSVLIKNENSHEKKILLLG